MKGTVMAYTPEKIRNIAIIGHQGSGKTSLVESLAFKASAISKKGKIERKDTISDFKDDEKKRLSSISSSIIPIDYSGYHLNFIDVPGNDDFIYETISITRVIKGAVLVIDASKGVQTGTIKQFRLLKKRGVPIFIFINKMDKENVDFNSLFEDIKEKLDKDKCVPFSYPIGKEKNFDGFVNVVELKARKYNGVTCEDDEIYEDKKPIIFKLHNRLCEAVATTDDAMLEKFFSGEPLSHEEIKIGLRKGVLSGELYPIIVGSATKDIGINTLLNMFIDYLPSPKDLKPIEATFNDDVIEVPTDENEEVSLQVFKNVYFQFQGMISIFKICSGTLHINDELFCPNNNRTYKISSLYRIMGDKLTPVSEGTAGDILAVGKLDDIHLSYTLTSPKRKVMFKEIVYPTPTYKKAIYLESKSDSDKLFANFEKLTAEDPSLSIQRDPVTEEIVIAALSSSHLQDALERLNEMANIKYRLENIKIAYKETITKEATGNGRYIKQSGGSGFYGVVEMDFLPSDSISFESKVFGGHIDKGYFPAVEKGFIEACKSGGLVGAPVINVKAILKDGKQHTVDSNELAFKNAAILAFKDAYMKAEPVLLEPYYQITINVPNEYLGLILSDLAKRRARISNTLLSSYDTVDIIAIVPEKEILDYANDIKSITKGIGFFNLKFFDYEVVNETLSKKIIEEYQSR